MKSHGHVSNASVQIESLESRRLFSASDFLSVSPPSSQNTPAYKVAPQGCDNGISPHAQPSSDGVVACFQGE